MICLNKPLIMRTLTTTLLGVFFVLGFNVNLAVSQTFGDRLANEEKIYVIPYKGPKLFLTETSDFNVPVPNSKKDIESASVGDEVVFIEYRKPDQNFVLKEVFDKSQEQEINDRVIAYLSDKLGDDKIVKASDEFDLANHEGNFVIVMGTGGSSHRNGMGLTYDYFGNMLPDGVGKLNFGNKFFISLMEKNAKGNWKVKVHCQKGATVGGGSIEYGEGLEYPDIDEAVAASIEEYYNGIDEELTKALERLDKRLDKQWSKK